MNYKLIQTNNFKRKLKHLKKSNNIVYENIKEGLTEIKNNPYNVADIQLKSKNVQNVEDIGLIIIV